MIRNFLQEIKGINLVDIGSSGDLDHKWDPIKSSINLVGFDPNEDECRRMAQLPTSLKSVQYLPIAISGEKGVNKLFKTKSIFCYSLLEPNLEWLRRFSFHDLFEIQEVSSIKTDTLSNIPEVNRMDIDVLKTDTQGLELPILKNAKSILRKAFLVETETGFVENYNGETTYAQIDEFMRANGFLLFDINTTHRVARNNVFKNVNTKHEQLMWCEAVWLKDYIALAKEGKIDKDNTSREKLLKALILCSHQGCIDYGYEIATMAYDFGAITISELRSLESPESWSLKDIRPTNQTTAPYARMVNFILRLFPAKVRRVIKEQAEQAIHQRHLFRS